MARRFGGLAFIVAVAVVIAGAPVAPASAQQAPCNPAVQTCS